MEKPENERRTNWKPSPSAFRLGVRGLYRNLVLGRLLRIAS